MQSNSLFISMVTATPAATMEPLSARIPSDLYLWLAQLQVEGAATNSDKLRVLLHQLKRQHDGTLDYVAAHAWARELTARAREALVRAEGLTGQSSETANVLIEHLTSLLALVISQSPSDEQKARQFEDALVRRAFALTESLLRKAIAPHASAFDPQVVRRHAGPTAELAVHLSTLKGSNHG